MKDIKQHLVNLLFEEYKQEYLFNELDGMGIGLKGICVENMDIIYDMIGFPEGEKDFFTTDDPENGETPMLHLRTGYDENIFNRNELKEEYFTIYDALVDEEKICFTEKGMQMRSGADSETIRAGLLEYIDWLYLELERWKNKEEEEENNEKFGVAKDIKIHFLNLLLEECKQRCLFEELVPKQIDLRDICVHNLHIILDMIGFPPDSGGMIYFGDVRKGEPPGAILERMRKDDKNFNRGWVEKKFHRICTALNAEHNIRVTDNGMQLDSGIDIDIARQRLAAYIDWVYGEWEWLDKEEGNDKG